MIGTPDLKNRNAGKAYSVTGGWLLTVTEICPVKNPISKRLKGLSVRFGPSKVNPKMGSFRPEMQANDE